MLGGVNYFQGRRSSAPALRTPGAPRAASSVSTWRTPPEISRCSLHDWNADFAVWCSYKYLNGGPGCIAGCFVHERHARNTDLPRFAGWWGHDKQTRFRMGPEFHAIPSAEGWQVSNPSILSLAALRASMEIFDEVGNRAIAREERID